MRGPTRVQRKESEKHSFRGTPKKPEKCQFLTDSAQNVQFSSFPEKNKNITFLHSLRLEFLQKIREIQYAVFEKMRKTLDFGNFWPFWKDEHQENNIF